MNAGYIGTGGHAGFFLKQLRKILRTVSAAHLLCYGLNLIAFGRDKQLFGPFDSDIGEIAGKTGASFLLKFFTDIVCVHKQMLLCNPL